MVRGMRAAWCDIDLEALRANADALVRQAGVPLLPIVKAEAYGHGLLPVARCLGGHPEVWGLGVALTGEAAELRRDGFTGRVLVLGGMLPEECEEAVTAGATVAISSLTLAEVLGRTATALGHTVPVHLKVDVGMNRLGVPAGRAAEAAERIAATPGLRLEGILCHLGAAHDGEPASLARTRAEVARFEGLTAPILARRGPLVRHAANSSALLTLPEAAFDLVRPGLTLYGWRPAEWLPPRPELRPVLSLRARVALVKTAGEGARVGYTQTPVPAGARLGVLPVGYGDGLPQAWGLKGGRVLFPDGPAPIVGSVCMDSCVVDLTDLPAVGQGSIGLLLGAGPEGVISPEEVARSTGRNVYEVLVGLAPRLPRRYLG